MNRKSGWSAMVAVFALSFGCGCDECSVGSTWCEDDDVMVCVADDESEEDDDWGDADEADDGGDSWLDVIIGIFQIADAADGEGRSEVSVSCADLKRVCVEKADAENGDISAVCERKTDW